MKTLQTEIAELCQKNPDWSDVDIAAAARTSREYVRTALTRVGLKPAPGCQVPAGWACPCGHTGRLVPSVCKAEK